MEWEALMLAKLLHDQIATQGWKYQSSLVRRSGLSQALVSKLLRGEITNITIRTADRLARALHIAVEQVFAAALADVRQATQDSADDTADHR